MLIANKTNYFKFDFKLSVFNELFEVILTSQFLGLYRETRNNGVTFEESRLISTFKESADESNRCTVNAAILFNDSAQYYDYLTKLRPNPEDEIPFGNVIFNLPKTPFWDRITWRKLFFDNSTTMKILLCYASVIDAKLSEGLPCPVSMKRRELEASYFSQDVVVENTVSTLMRKTAEAKAQWYENIAKKIPADKKRVNFSEAITVDKILAKALTKKANIRQNKASKKKLYMLNNQLRTWLKQYGIEPQELKKRDLTHLSASELIDILANAWHPKLFPIYPDYIRACVMSGMSLGDTEDGLLYWEKSRKKIAILPDVQIEGKGQLQDYYLCSVSNKTPRGLTLGIETNCCQAFAGASEHVVVKGIRDPYQGFYAVMKYAEKGVMNQASDELRVQSYAWLGKDALVIDSLESKRPAEIGRFMPLYHALFENVLGYQYTYKDEKYTIKTIVIGCGGNTPKALDYDVIKGEQCIQHLDGSHLQDATKQYLAAKDGKVYAFKKSVVESNSQAFFSNVDNLMQVEPMITDELLTFNQI